MSRALAFAIVMLAAACAGPAPGPMTVAPDLALARTGSGEAILIDVRLPQERGDRRMPPDAAGWLPFDRYDPSGFANAVLDAVDGDRTRPVLLICEVGVRSTWAARALGEARFTQVLSVEQGYARWRAEGLPLVAGGDEPAAFLLRE